MKPIYIATFHQSKFGKLMGMTVPQIVDAAIQGACRQIGTEPAALDVGSIGAACNFSLNEQGLLAGLMADTPGLEGKPIEAVENACASGGQAVLSRDPEAATRHGRHRHRRGLRKDARCRRQDGRQADRQGARLLLPSRRARGQGLRLPAHLRRSDARVHGRLRRHRSAIWRPSRCRNMPTRSSTPARR